MALCMRMREGFPGVADIDLPREKMERLGPEALRNEELLAVLLRTGYEGKNVLEIASEILVKRTPEELMKMGLAELTRIKGIGRAKAAGTARAARTRRQQRQSQLPAVHTAFHGYEALTTPRTACSPSISCSAMVASAGPGPYVTLNESVSSLR